MGNPGRQDLTANRERRFGKICSVELVLKLFTYTHRTFIQCAADKKNQYTFSIQFIYKVPIHRKCRLEAFCTQKSNFNPLQLILVINQCITLSLFVKLIKKFLSQETQHIASSCLPAATPPGWRCIGNHLCRCPYIDPSCRSCSGPVKVQTWICDHSWKLMFAGTTRPIYLSVDELIMPSCANR